MKKIVTILAAVAIAALTATSALAETSAAAQDPLYAAVVAAMKSAADSKFPPQLVGDFAVTVSAGTAIWNDHHGAQLSPGGRFGVGFEGPAYFTNPYVGVSGSHDISVQFADFDRLQDTAAGPGNPANGNMWTISYTEGAKVVFPVSGIFTPFIGGGFGPTFVHQSATTGNAGWTNNNWAFGYYGTAGFKSIMPGKGTLDIAYRFDGTSHVPGGGLGGHAITVTAGFPVF